MSAVLPGAAKNAAGDKTVLLFDAAISLLQEGLPVHEIKMSDIARRAGIGKGTIYDYFESKEQLIHKAKIYAIDCLTDEVARAVGTKDDFGSKVHEFIISLTGKAAENGILFQSIAKHDVPAMLMQECSPQDDYRGIIEKWLVIVNGLVRSALTDGIIMREPNVYKTHVAVLSLVVTSFMYCRNPARYEDVTQEDMIKTATENFGKMLG
ncbi:MAG: helix-turn-helix transcriptional regulator [Clostridia bacterium]|nr:helix-turn-helix transcriptional regulator [Clostridia bacterium]